MSKQAFDFTTAAIAVEEGSRARNASTLLRIAAASTSTQLQAPAGRIDRVLSMPGSYGSPEPRG